MRFMDGKHLQNAESVLHAEVDGITNRPRVPDSKVVVVTHGEYRNPQARAPVRERNLVLSYRSQDTQIDLVFIFK